MLDFVMVKDLLEFFVSNFCRHTFYNETLTIFLILVGFGETDLYVFAQASLHFVFGLQDYDVSWGVSDY